MKKLFVITLIFMTLLLSCSGNTYKDKQFQTEINSNQQSIHHTAKNDSSYVSTGFYFLADDGQGIKMRKDHSDDVYDISQNPFASIKNILRATVQKNVIEGRDTYGVTIVLDNDGTKDLEEGTGNSAHPYIAVVIANRLLYVVENTSKIKTGIMQIILVDYSETEVNDMIDAINQKR